MDEFLSTMFQPSLMSLSFIYSNVESESLSATNVKSLLDSSSEHQGADLTSNKTLVSKALLNTGGTFQLIILCYYTPQDCSSVEQELNLELSCVFLLNLLLSLVRPDSFYVNLDSLLPTSYSVL